MNYIDISKETEEGNWMTYEAAADALGITAHRLKALGMIDKVVSEPLGGAHRDHAAMAQNLKKALQDALKQLAALSTTELLATRYERLMSYGRFKEQAVN